MFQSDCYDIIMYIYIARFAVTYSNRKADEFCGLISRSGDRQIRQMLSDFTSVCKAYKLHVEPFVKYTKTPKKFRAQKFIAHLRPIPG